MPALRRPAEARFAAPDSPRRSAGPKAGRTAGRNPGYRGQYRPSMDEGPNAAQAARRVALLRSITLWTVRVVGLAMLVRGVYLVVNRLTFGLSQGDIARGWNAYTGVGEGHMLAAGVAATLVGLALVLLARPMSRLAIAMPDTGCPACGHTGEVDGQGRCVECGCTLSGARE